MSKEALNKRVQVTGKRKKTLFFDLREETFKWTIDRVVKLTGYDLKIEDIIAIGIGDKRVELDVGAIKNCRASRDYLEKEVRSQRIIYGVNTSFGLDVQQDR